MKPPPIRQTSRAGTIELSYRPDIDGLRAIAVLGVIAFHSGLPHFPGGFVGVDVFFVISGFLITGLLSAEFERTGQISLRDFFARRIRRLLPALALVTLVTLLVAMLTMFPRDMHRVGSSAQAVATLTANVHFRNFSGGYFDPSTDVMPLLHAWSLAVEEQYYLAWPLLILLTHRIWRSPGRSVHRTTIITLALVSALSFAACVWMTLHDRLSAFYLTPYRAWEFALGALLAHGIPSLRARLSARSGDLLFLAGLAIILGMMLFYDEQMPFPGAIAIVPVIGSLAVIAGGAIPAAAWPSRLLGNRLMVGIGVISYSLYLWHWPLLALARDYRLGNRDLPWDMAMIAVSFLLALLTYRYVEDPIRVRKPGPFGSRAGTFRSGFLISLLLIVAANGLMHWSKGRNAELGAETRRIFTAAQPPASTRCTQKEDGLSLPPANDCRVGPDSAPVRLASWGDSHSGQLVPMFAQASKDFGFATLTRNLGACPPLMGVVPFKRDEARSGCAHFNGLVLAELAERASHDLRGVVLAGRWNNYLALPVTQPGGTYAYALGSTQYSPDNPEQQGAGRLEVGKPPLDTPGSTAVLQESLHNTLAVLAGKGLRVVVVAPMPELHFNGPQCLYRRTPEQCTVPRTKVEARRAPAMAALNKAIEGFGNVRLYDPIDEFCDASLCYTERNHVIQYADDQHVSRDMAILLRKPMDSLLLWAAGID